jgi:acyl transferase domain-containing protein
LTESDDKSLLDPTERSQPVCAALQIALVDLLASWNIKAAAVVGHSSGEVGAAYAAGILTRQEAIITAYYRGYACSQNKLDGGMAAIGLGADAVKQHLGPGVVLACENSNASVTISGDSVALDSTMESLRQAYPNALVRRLRVPMAYHSRE